MIAGDLATITPTDSKAAIFSTAPPFPPEIMAPACPKKSNHLIPMRLPGGAVCPAIKDTIGFAFGREKLNFFKYSAASSSADPPISPIRTIPTLKHENSNL